jgi:hypothetical protein
MPGCNHCPSDESAKSAANNPGFRKVLWIALIANAAMFFIEVGASWSAGSVSLLADSLDFGGDAANYALSLFVLGMALQTRAKAALLKGISMGPVWHRRIGFCGVCSSSGRSTFLCHHGCSGFAGFECERWGCSNSVPLPQWRFQYAIGVAVQPQRCDWQPGGAGCRLVGGCDTNRLA